MSFQDVIENIKETLTGDAALRSYLIAAFGKELTVTTGYRVRVEIGLEQLPYVLLTRPDTEKDFVSGGRDGKHTVRIYFGFYAENKEEAAKHLIRIEELIDDALLKDYTRGGHAIWTHPTLSSNDEGRHHPTYFFVSDIEILHRRMG